MKSKLSIILIFFCVTAFSQSNSPTPEQVRQYIAQGISKLKVVPEEIAQVENTFVKGGNESIPIRIYRHMLDKTLPVLYLVHGAG